MQYDIAEIKLRAERRIGEFSRELPKNERARTDLSAPHDGEQTKTSILQEAGITHPERYEAIASLPDEVFERHIQEVKQSNEELTLKRIRRLYAACYFGFDKCSKVARIPLKQPVPVMSHSHTGLSSWKRGMVIRLGWKHPYKRLIVEAMTFCN